MSTPANTTYRSLVQSLSDVLAAGKLRAQQAVERERLTTYHEVGRLLDTHLMKEGKATDYGERLFERLAEDLGIAERLLRDGHILYRWHPILHARAELGWTHYRILLRVPDDQVRNRLETEAAKSNWTTRELERRVRVALPSGNAEDDTDEPETPSTSDALTPLRGLLNIGRGIDLPPAGRVLDLGFTNYALPHELNQKTFPKGDLTLNRSHHMYLVRKTRRRKAKHYTYLAQVERVIDGDTLLLHIHPIFGSFYRERVRLRGIDTPEMPTKEGKRAKAFVETVLAEHKWIGITSTKPDAYDRYLVDVFIPNENDRDQRIVDHGRFLNQMLLDEGLARRVDY